MIIYTTNEFNFYEKKTETLLIQFWVIIYVISEFNLKEKANALFTQFWTITYITSESNFCKNLRILFFKKIHILLA